MLVTVLVLPLPLPLPLVHVVVPALVHVVAVGATAVA